MNSTDSPATPDSFGAGAAHTDPAPGFTEPVVPQRPVKRGVAIGTLVFGLIALAIAGTILASTFFNIQIHAGMMAVAILIGAGLIMIIGGVAATRRTAAEAAFPAEIPTDITDPTVKG